MTMCPKIQDRFHVKLALYEKSSTEGHGYDKYVVESEAINLKCE